jgi:selenocysteine-specific elongation factor
MKKPLMEGISMKELRTRTGGDAGPEMFQAAVAQLAAAGTVLVTHDTVKLAGRTVRLSDEELRMRKGIEAAFAQSGLVSPSPAEAFTKLGFDPTRAQKVFQLLLREGILVKVAEGIVFHTSALEDLRRILGQRKREQGSRLSIGAFKELAGVSRKYAIPLLEYLDRTGVTRRDGDERIVI